MPGMLRLIHPSGVADVTVRNMTIVNTGFAFRLKTGAGRGG